MPDKKCAEETTVMQAADALDAVFTPQRVAVLGASADPTKFGYQIVSNLRQFGFPGEVFPISRSVREIAGFKAVPALRDLPHAVDLVLVSIPAASVPAAIADAASIGAKAAVVFTAGFAEEGEQGRRLQQEVAAAAAGRIRIVGPNCLGVRNFHHPMNGTPMRIATPDPGPIAMISQSGAFGNAASAALIPARIGMSKLASIGNMVDLTHADFFRYCADDPETNVIAAFVEGVPNADAFLDAIAYASARKPVVILKGGRSKVGQAAALSHTGSLAGDGRVWQSLIAEAGATAVGSTQELFDVAAAFARLGPRLPRSRRTAIFSLAGGPAVVAADHCEEHGLELPWLEAALAHIRPLVPPWAALGNPVEVTGQTRRENFDACVGAVAALEQVDSIFGIAVGLDISEFGAALVKASASKPVVACVVAPNTEELFARSGIPNFPSVDRAARVLARLAERGCVASASTAELPPLSPRALPAGTQTEAQSKAYLAAYGLPVTRERVVQSADAAAAAAGEIGYPVALKISSAEVAHKTDCGGVLLNLEDETALRQACEILHNGFPGKAMLVQKMVRRGIELIVGAQRTPATGPVLMLGLGGVLTEVLEDVVFCRAPASPQSVLAALSGLRAQRLLDGYRGMPPVNRRAVAEVASRLSQIVAANPEISEVDINPLMADAEGTIIVDALIRVETKPAAMVGAAA
jgi:acetyltransferase